MESANIQITKSLDNINLTKITFKCFYFQFLYNGFFAIDTNVGWILLKKGFQKRLTERVKNKKNQNVSICL